MLMCRDRVHAEAAVRRNVDRQSVVMPHEQRLADANLEEFRRQRAVEGPDRLVFLNRHVRVETDADAGGCPIESGQPGGVVVKAARSPFALRVSMALAVIARAGVYPCAGLCGLEIFCRVELVPALVRPPAPGRAAFRRWRVQSAPEEPFDVGPPGIFRVGVGKLARKRRDTRFGQERVKRHGVGTASGGVERIQSGIGPDRRPGERRRRRYGGIQWLRTEFLEAQHLLRKRLGTEQGTRPAAGRYVVFSTAVEVIL